VVEAVVVLVPQDPYDQKHYLADAARAFWHKVRYEHSSYWPRYSGVKIPFSWWRLAGKLLVVSVWACMIYAVLWMQVYR
jgi:hypothetical protein